MLPPLPTRSAGARKFYWWAVRVAHELRDPFMRARLRGVLDYLLGRSGDCPQAVLRLAASERPAAAPSSF